jgi:hypothetical protein
VKTPGNAGPWSKVSHPLRGRSGGCHPCSSENTAIETLLTPKIHLRKVKTKICIKVNSSKEKEKAELFQMDSIPELNTKNLENSPSFLSVTHTTLFAKQFRSYGILTIDIAAEFCF